MSNNSVKTSTPVLFSKNDGAQSNSDQQKLCDKIRIVAQPKIQVESSKLSSSKEEVKRASEMIRRNSASGKKPTASETRSRTTSGTRLGKRPGTTSGTASGTRLGTRPGTRTGTTSRATLGTTSGTASGTRTGTTSRATLGTTSGTRPGTRLGTTSTASGEKSTTLPEKRKTLNKYNNFLGTQVNEMVQDVVSKKMDPYLKNMEERINEILNLTESDEDFKKNVLDQISELRKSVESLSDAISQKPEECAGNINDLTNVTRGAEVSQLIDSLNNIASNLGNYVVSNNLLFARLLTVPLVSGSLPSVDSKHEPVVPSAPASGPPPLEKVKGKPKDERSRDIVDDIKDFFSEGRKLKKVKSADRSEKDIGNEEKKSQLNAEELTTEKDTGNEEQESQPVNTVESTTEKDMGNEEKKLQPVNTVESTTEKDMGNEEKKLQPVNIKESTIGESMV